LVRIKFRSGYPWSAKRGVLVLVWWSLGGHRFWRRNVKLLLRVEDIPALERDERGPRACGYCDRILRPHRFICCNNRIEGIQGKTFWEGSPIWEGRVANAARMGRARQMNCHLPNSTWNCNHDQQTGKRRIHLKEKTGRLLENGAKGGRGETLVEGRGEKKQPVKCANGAHW